MFLVLLGWAGLPACEADVSERHVKRVSDHGGALKLMFLNSAESLHLQRTVYTERKL